MKLIVGLGNPGKKYEKTRHNIGFLLIDKFLGNVAWQSKPDALIYETKFGREKIIFIKPLLYMNLSGIVVKKYLKYFKIKIEDLLIIQDDIDMPIGNYKLKNHSTSGGHNGIQSIIDNINTTDFLRIKIGVNNANNKDAKDFVLSKFTKKEVEILNEIFDLAIHDINKFILEKK